jgi:hypothetical protein
VLRPELLGAAEEAYFRPFIFNVWESEARRDYIDIHGSRIGAADEAMFQRFAATTLKAAAALEQVSGAPRQSWLRQMATSLRMWVSVMESVQNFSAAQPIRDARAQELSAPPPAHFKQAGNAGDPDYFCWYQILRRELDNSAELIRLLNSGGLANFARARRAEDEDTFLLGPDIVPSLEKKRRIMRAYWLDAQRYLAPPNR